MSFEEELFDLLELIKGFGKKMKHDNYIVFFIPLEYVESFMSFGLLVAIEPFASLLVGGLLGSVGTFVIHWDPLKFSWRK